MCINKVGPRRLRNYVELIHARALFRQSTANI